MTLEKSHILPVTRNVNRKITTLNRLTVMRIDVINSVQINIYGNGMSITHPSCFLLNLKENTETPYLANNEPETYDIKSIDWTFDVMLHNVN